MPARHCMQDRTGPNRFEVVDYPESLDLTPLAPYAW